jgi:hypothetical protein
MPKAGRPKTSKLTRSEQVARAKRRQRARERTAGLVHVQLTVPRALAGKITVARQSETFLNALEAALDRQVIRISDYPQLKTLAWNRDTEALIPSHEAFNLYERNWKFVNAARLTEPERELVARLVDEFGNGIVHA